MNRLGIVEKTVVNEAMTSNLLLEKQLTEAAADNAVEAWVATERSWKQRH